jgi:hypothetical protein
MPLGEQVDAASESEGYAASAMFRESVADAPTPSSLRPVTGGAAARRLTSRAYRTEEEHLVLVVVIGVNQVRAPASSFGISRSPAFGAEKLGGSHRDG